MALMNCKECGHQMSDTAKACPACGAKPDKPVSWVTLVVVGVLAAFMLNAYLSKSPDASAPVEAPDPYAGARWQAATGLVNVLKPALRDPDSLRFEHLLTDEQGDTVCAVYRAKNGFGGYDKRALMVTPGETVTDAGRWNDLCAQALYDMRYAVK